jgi:hypothetical protein
MGHAGKGEGRKDRTTPSSPRKRGPSETRKPPKASYLRTSLKHSTRVTDTGLLCRPPRSALAKSRASIEKSLVRKRARPPGRHRQCSALSARGGSDPALDRRAFRGIRVGGQGLRCGPCFACSTFFGAGFRPIGDKTREALDRKCAAPGVL